MRSFFISVLVLAGVLLCAAQDTKQSIPSMAEMMKKVVAAATPGEMHKKLDAFVGSWKTKSSMWTQGPDKPPTVTEGSATYEWVLGGRFLKEDFKGTVMGKPLIGIGYNGYDNMRKKYTMFWIDDMGTVMSTGDGNFDPTGKLLTYYGKMDAPVSGEYDKTVKYVTRIVNPDDFIFEIHDLTLGGDQTKVLEVEYMRANLK